MTPRLVQNQVAELNSYLYLYYIYLSLSAFSSVSVSVSMPVCPVPNGNTWFEPCFFRIQHVESVLTLCWMMLVKLD